MNIHRSLAPLCAALALLPGGISVADAGTPRPATAVPVFEQWRETAHRGNDELLTAGLGIDALRSATAPAFSNPAQPTAEEARRRAIWSSWRGIADLTPGGGFGDVYGSLQAVPGREFSAYARISGARQPHRVLVQVPDSFDASRRCLVVAASSGSRGIYGAIAVAGSWGLAHGCAIAYTDKGAGSDYYDLHAKAGFQADGTPASQGALAFIPAGAAATQGVAFKHAHSGDNPEADWGRHLLQALQFGLQSLDRAYPESKPFTAANTRTLGVGVSNGGGAVLRAAEIEGDWFDAMVAGEPNVSVAGAPPLYDFVTQAALLMPCALLAEDDLPQPPMRAQAVPVWTQRCATLKSAGSVQGDDTAAQARSARQQLLDAGLSDDALRAGVFSTGFDLWRAIAATYSSAYGRYGAGEHPCAYSFSATGADGRPGAAAAEARATWWSEGSGIPPGNGVVLADGNSAGAADNPLHGLNCLRALGNGDSADARRVRGGIAAATAKAPRRGLPIVVIHGIDDGLVPISMTSDRYVPLARKAGAQITYWRVNNAQHFDSLLAFPDYRKRYVPLLPYMFAAMDQVWDHLEDPAHPLPLDALIQPTPRAEAPLLREQLSIPAAQAIPRR
ncbi:MULTISPECIES: 3-hydroxybutyrate oligomer hydrolase family protein [Stenotrophomonas]|uniref:3-hydroxybutyrate oligomer hydrolase family protein n=1 Tax=Stenotrophomonas TaxID=40323 RepID=UPI000B6DF00A|nr:MULTISPECIES: 3-hydroxybutyrate oligomer hydrolase family protein [Stenotrophomonas]SMR81217.1 hydroxybutyrate-dimer hydrolase [Stenotrophomonas sp. yr243]SNS33094.1 hydroxybutyrate-dimer hydrolase [Stenotrophomonas lactitubi]